MVSSRALPPETSGLILAWLEACEFWRLVETGFYDQYEFDLRDVRLPTEVAFLRLAPAFWHNSESEWKTCSRLGWEIIPT